VIEILEGGCEVVDEERATEETNEMTIGQTPLGDSAFLLQTLQSDMRASKKRLVSTQKHTIEIRSQQQELAIQMKTMMGMLQEVYKQNGGTADVTSYSFDEDTKKNPS
jgi:hypothetical protein